MLVWSKRS